MASGREKRILAETIVKYCKKVDEDDENITGTYNCKWPFSIYYSGGSLEVKTNNVVTISDDTIVVKQSDGTLGEQKDDGIGSFFMSLAQGLAKAIAAPEHTILWSSVTRIGG